MAITRHRSSSSTAGRWSSSPPCPAGPMAFSARAAGASGAHPARAVPVQHQRVFGWILAGFGANASRGGRQFRPAM